MIKYKQIMYAFGLDIRIVIIITIIYIYIYNDYILGIYPIGYILDVGLITEIVYGFYG